MFFQSGRIIRPENGNDTVSEGIAYGMLLSAYADDQPTFDKLWQYSQKWPDGNGLMNWYINAAGTQVLGTGAASDADEDMAYALIAADARWSGRGSLTTNYIELAKTLIGKIWHEQPDAAQALELLGYAPNLSTCVVCERPLLPEATYFSPPAGGLVCAAD